MKKNRISITSIMFVILIAPMIITNCDSTKDNLTNERLFYDVNSKKTFNLDNQVQLNELATILSNETTEIKISKDAFVTELTDSKGTFNAISFTYQTGNVTTKMIFPLSEATSDRNETLADDCVMKFIYSSGFSICATEIIERCKTQKCICSNGGECTSSMTFND